MNTLRVNSCSISTKKLLFKLMNLSFKGTLFQVQTQGCEEREREREREIVFTELQSTPSLHQNTLEEINEATYKIVWKT